MCVYWVNEIAYAHTLLWTLNNNHLYLQCVVATFTIIKS